VFMVILFSTHNPFFVCVYGDVVYGDFVLYTSSIFYMCLWCCCLGWC